MGVSTLTGNKRQTKETYVFETVKVLVALAARVAVEGLLLLHALGAGVGGARLGVDNGECSVAVFVELLRLMTVGFVVPAGNTWLALTCVCG